MLYTPTPTGCCHPSHTGKRRVSRSTMCYYQDLDHGVKEGPCCYKCYARHLLKYYPDSLVAAHIRKNPGEYKNRYETKTRK